MADDSHNSGGEETELTTIASDLVVTKYKMASEITNRNSL
jgi:hypothetical protein